MDLTDVVADKPKAVIPRVTYSEEQKLRACTTWFLTGNLMEVSRTYDIPYETLKTWAQSAWWKDLVVQIRFEDVQMLDSKLQRIIKKSLEATEDRVDNGDTQYDPKTGKLLKIPVKAHVVSKVANEMMQRQAQLRKVPSQREIETTIDSRLKKLAEEFMRFAKPKVQPEVVINPAGVTE